MRRGPQDRVLLRKVFRLPDLNFRLKLLFLNNRPDIRLSSTQWLLPTTRSVMDWPLSKTTDNRLCMLGRSSLVQLRHMVRPRPICTVKLKECTGILQCSHNRCITSSSALKIRLLAKTRGTAMRDMTAAKETLTLRAKGTMRSANVYAPHNTWWQKRCLNEAL